MKNPKPTAVLKEIDPLDFDMPDMDDIEADQKEMKSGASGLYIRLEDGKTIIRPLPGKPTWEDKRFYRKLWQHFMGKGIRPLVCRMKHLGKKCRGCEVKEDLSKRGKNVSQMEPRAQYMANVWLPKSGTNEVKILTMPKTVMGALLSYYADPEWEDLIHPRKGRNITVVRSGVELKTEYEVKPSPNQSEVPEEVMAARLDLDEVLEKQILSYKEQCAILEGKKGGDDDDEEEEEERPKKASKSKRPSMDDDDDEED